MQYFSRPRTLLAKAMSVGFALMMVVVMAACGGASSTGSSSSSSGPVNLTFWSWVPNIQTSIDLFNSTHPGIHVTLNSVTAGNNGTYAKMFTAIKAHNAPDLGQIEYQFLPTFEATGGLLDMAPYLDGSIKNRFVGWTWNQSTLGNAIYAIPQDTGPMAMFYRADIFKKYNISPPTTWAEYAADAVKLHAANPNYYITDFPPKDAGWFIGLIWQAGGRWFRINGNSWKVAINDANSKMVANFWQDLLDKKLVKTDPDFSAAWNNDLANGGALTWISAVWGANTIKSGAPSASGDWRVAPMPQWAPGQNVAGNWGGSTTVVFKDTKHPKEATEFAQWLNTNSDSVNKMVTGASLYPALTSALSSPTVNSPQPYYGNQVVNQVFQQVSGQVDINFQWGPTMDQVFTDLGDDFTNVVNGQGTLSGALDMLQSSTVANMQKQGFSVSP
jgi:multiple sugar transport system substrate-binding protein